MLQNNEYEQAIGSFISDGSQSHGENTTRLNDPFENPTEYHSFRDDYSKILPWLKMDGYRVPLTPARAERSMLKRFYNIGGLCVLMQYLFAQFGATIIYLIIRSLLSWINPNTDVSVVTSYMENTSIATGLNMLVFVTFNVLFAMLGLKWAEIKEPSLFRTKGFNWRYAVEYCIIGLAIWLICHYISIGIEGIFEQLGHSTYTSGMGDSASTGIGISVELIYSCIMAPVTEELFFRGMLLRVFSKGSQRFGVFASALFFGLLHGNLPQFVLAFFFGLFLGHITLKHGSIIPSIMVHMFINTFVTVSSYASDTTILAALINMFLIAAFLSGIVLLLIFRKTDRLPSTTPAQARRGLAVAKTSIPFDLAFVVTTLMMVLLLMNN